MGNNPRNIHLEVCYVLWHYRDAQGWRLRYKYKYDKMQGRMFSVFSFKLIDGMLGFVKIQMIYYKLSDKWIYNVNFFYLAWHMFSDTHCSYFLNFLHFLRFMLLF